MGKREKNMSIIRSVAGAAFGVSFLMAIFLFTNFGRGFISILTAKYIFIGSGAVGFFLNLLAFQTGKHHPVYNFIYWSGSIILFVGLVFTLMRWPYAIYIVIGGAIVLGVSFLLPAQLSDVKPKNPGLLDD